MGTEWLDAGQQSDRSCGGLEGDHRSGLMALCSGTVHGRGSDSMLRARGEHTLLALVEDEFGSDFCGSRLTGPDGRRLERPPLIMTSSTEAKGR